MPDAFCASGKIAEGLATVDEAIARTEEAEEYVFMAELLRIKGELLLLQRAPGAAGRPRTSFGKRSIGRVGKARSPGNCAPPRASPGCCATKVAPPRRWRSSSRSMTGSQQASTRPISKQQNGCSTVYGPLPAKRRISECLRVRYSSASPTWRNCSGLLSSEPGRGRL